VTVTQDALATVAGMLGHELRNPLAAAITGATLARELVDAGDPRGALLDGVLRDLERTAALLQSYLEFARVGAPRREPVEVELLVRAVARRHRVAVAVAVPPGTRVRGDRQLLERALDNLLDNAQKAGARTVSLTARLLGEQVQLLVDDDGRGVPPALLGRIFESGFSHGGGTGLGLWITAAVVAGHGGAVRCLPQPRGSRFCIDLPAMAPVLAAVTA